MWRSGVILALGMWATAAFGVAEEPESAADVKEERNREFEQLTRLVPEYSFSRDEDSSVPFELMAQPILRWSNPVRQTRDGAVYLWLDQGRPALIMCAFWRNDTEMKHEFQSLHPELFTGTLDGEIVWTPREAGLQFADVPDAPRVASSSRLRLVQMRNIAANYVGTVGTVERPMEQLRLLSQPLYRYESPQQTPGLIDGAIFALVQTTDPEILILLEAREDSAGAVGWYVAFARMSRWALHVRRRGEVLWSLPWRPGEVDEPYHVLSHFVTQAEQSD